MANKFGKFEQLSVIKNVIYLKVMNLDENCVGSNGLLFHCPDGNDESLIYCCVSGTQIYCCSFDERAHIGDHSR